jgi:hypothetical protein
MNMEDMKADPRFEMKGNIQDLKKNPDGSSMLNNLENLVTLMLM